MEATQKLFFVIASVITIAVQLDSVSVNSALCPTNKIAPHKRAASWEAPQPRTLGLIYSLLTPSRPRPPSINNYNDDLQEKPQEDDPDDCGEIEDYDETDLSSITPTGQNNYYYNKNNKKRNDRYLFDNDFIIPQYYQTPNRPVRPPKRPSSSNRPQRPAYPSTKPPYHSGGVFGSNVYRPPAQHYPSNHIKPVHENTYDSQTAAYRPGLVGGALLHVIGFTPKRPVNSDEDVTPPSKRPSTPFRFPDGDSYKRRHTRAKESNVVTSILGSFVDLFYNK